MSPLAVAPALATPIEIESAEASARASASPPRGVAPSTGSMPLKATIEMPPPVLVVLDVAPET